LRKTKVAGRNGVAYCVLTPSGSQNFISAGGRLPAFAGEAQLEHVPITFDRDML
jgi:hypothetical protein